MQISSKKKWTFMSISTIVYSVPLHFPFTKENQMTTLIEQIRERSNWKAYALWLEELAVERLNAEALAEAHVLREAIFQATDLLKSVGTLKSRAGSSPAPGKLNRRFAHCLDRLSVLPSIWLLRGIG
jgi:hypothetical protein